MLCKAIIENKISAFQYQVRIPTLDKASNSINANYYLQTATVAHLPGIIVDYNINDIVYVDFENDLYSNPVIIGLLSIADTLNSTASAINVESISVSLTNTNHETISQTALEDIKSQISDIKSQISDAETQISDIKSQISDAETQLSNI